MSTALRSGLIRLAFSNPELRADLLPLIEKEAAGPSYKDYVEKKRKKGEKPLDEEAWEARTKGKGEGGDKSEEKDGDKKDEDKGGGKTVSLSRAEGEKLSEALGGWHSSASDPLYTVSSHAGFGHPIPAEAAKKALGKVTTMLDNADAYRLSDSDKKQLSSAKKMLEKAVGSKAEKPKSEKPKSEKPKSEKPKASFKKNYRPTMESVMTKHELTDDDAKQVIEFSTDRPKKGKPQSPAELMRRFMEHAKPETKERMKGMNPNEFMKMLRAVLDDEEGGGKTASLRAGLIRLAYENPNMRPTLLPLLEKHAGDDEAMGEGDMGAELEAEADPTSHDQNLPEHYYFGKTAEERLENIENLLSQFASPASKGQNKPQSYYGLPPKGKQAARPLGPGVHVIEDLSVLGPNFRLVFRELGGDFLGSEQVPGYYLDLGGILKLVVKTPKMSPAGEAQAKKAIAKVLAMLKAGSAKTAGGSGAANAEYLRQSPLKNKILQAVAKHYGTSVSAIEAELTDPDAEAVFEYIGNDAGLQMQVYREFNAKGFGKRAAAGISVTLKKPVTLKDGTVIEAGTRGSLRFNEQSPRQVIVDFDTRPNTKLGVANLFDYFGRPFMKVPSMSSLSRMADGLSKSVTGKTVEPDGYGPDGSPSWLLILGMV